MTDQPQPEMALQPITPSDPVEAISQETNRMALDALLETVRSTDKGAGYAEGADAARSLATRTGAMVGDLERSYKLSV